MNLVVCSGLIQLLYHSCQNINLMRTAYLFKRAHKNSKVCEMGAFTGCIVLVGDSDRAAFIRPVPLGITEHV